MEGETRHGELETRAASDHEPSGGRALPAIAADRMRRLVLACGLITGVVALVVVARRIHDSSLLNQVSGAWAVLADDVAHGVIYRPIVSSLGYGGTRYFPVHFLLHGGLAATGLTVATAGHVLELAATCVLVGAAAYGLMRASVPRETAWAAALLTLASRTALMGVAGIRGDLLPVALGVLGLSLAAREDRGSQGFCALALSMAVFAKPTLVWAPGGALLALAARGEWRRVGSLAVMVSGLTVAFLGATQVISHGEMLRSVRACASGGGISLAHMIAAFGFVRPGETVWILGGVALTLLRGRRAFVDPFCAGALVCLPVTLVLFASSGIHVNHLIDVSTMGVLAVASAVFDPLAARRLAGTLLAAGTVLGLLEGVLLDSGNHKAGELQAAVDAIPPGTEPILSEHPWIPLLAGERPFLLDAYSLRLTRQISPETDRDFLARLDRCAFRAVVLIGRAEKAPEWYRDADFGAGFSEHLFAHYRFLKVAGSLPIYVPTCGAPPAAHASAASLDEETAMDRGARPSRVREIRAWLRSLLSR